MSSFEPAANQTQDNLAELEFLEKVKMIPIDGLMRRLEDELEDPILTDSDLPKELRITFLQLFNYLFELESSQFVMNPKFIEYLQKMVIKIADNSESCTIEGLLGMNLLASAVDSKSG